MNLPLRKGNSHRVLLFHAYPVWRGPASDMRLPLGMLYLGHSLKRAGYRVEAFHVEESQIDALLAEIDLTDAIFAGVCSVLTGFSLGCAISLSRKLKKIQSELPVVWGGVQPTAIPEVCLANDFVDAVGMGDGEDLIVEIAKALEGSLDPAKVKGLAYRDEQGRIRVNERRALKRDLDEYAADYSLIDLNDYIFEGRISGLIMSSRGCPYGCAFCYNSYFNQRTWRSHSQGYVVSLLKKLRSQYEFHTFSFSDDNFFAHKKRALAILQEAHDLGLRTFSLDIKINDLTPEDIRVIAACEVESVFFGTESLNPRLIKLIEKHQSREQVVKAIQGFSHFAPEVAVQTEILMALPFEQMQELRQDIRDGLDLYRYNRHLSVYFGVLFPLPQTKMMEHANENGFLPRTLEDYAGIDLNTAWSICDQWMPFKLSRSGKNQLRLTEQYSALLSVDLRFPKSSSWVFGLEWVKSWLIFQVARFRLRHWFFLFHRLDFFLWRHSWVGLALKVPGVGFLYRQARSFYQGRIEAVSPSVHYRNFGYLPRGSFWQDLEGKLFGHPNLLKRLQAREIMSALDVRPSHSVLDLGCGAGYFTVEMAKLAHKAYGIDVNPFVKTIKVPSCLQGKLEYIQAGGTQLPFPEESLDRVLASEVLPMISDPNRFVEEIRRVLKSDGRLVIVNGAGHPGIRDAYQRRPLLFRWLERRYAGRVPASYEDYCAILQASFGTSQKRFLEEADIRAMLEGNGFRTIHFDYTPGFLSGLYFSWSQFLLYLRRGQTISQRGFLLKFALFSLIRRFERRRFPGGLLCVAQK